MGAGDNEDGLSAYEKGDYKEAFIKFKSAAEKGDALAQRNLGQMYDDGKGVIQDCAQALRWYKLCENGKNLGALLDLGLIYYNGSQCVQQDYVKAIRLYRLVAKKEMPDNNPGLSLEWASCTMRGMGYSQTRLKLQDGIKWRLNKGIGFLSIGLVQCMKSEGVIQDYAEAVRWCKIAAQQGDTSAQLHLALMYGEGGKVFLKTL